MKASITISLDDANTEMCGIDCPYLSGAEQENPDPACDLFTASLVPSESNTIYRCRDCLGAARA